MDYFLLGLTSAAAGTVVNVAQVGQNLRDQQDASYVSIHYTAALFSEGITNLQVIICLFFC